MLKHFYAAYYQSEDSSEVVPVGLYKTESEAYHACIRHMRQLQIDHELPWCKSMNHAGVFISLNSKSGKFAFTIEKYIPYFV